MSYKINKITDIEIIKNEWSSCFQKSLNKNPFTSYEWCYSWLKAFNDNLNIEIYVIYDENNNVVSIIPLYYKKFFFFKIYRLIADNVSDYNDILLIENNKNLNIFIKNIFLKIKSQINSVFLLINISQNSNIYNILNDSFNSIEHSSTTKTVINNNYINSNCDKKQISNTKRLEKRLIEQFGNYKFELKNYDMAKLDKLLFYKKETLKKKNLNGIIFSDLYMKFLQNLLNIHSTNFFITSLSINDSLVSCSINFILDDVFYYYMPAYNSEFYKYSPSSMLLYKIFLFIDTNEEIKYFDFLKGDEDYKKIWANKAEETNLYLLTNISNFIVNLLIKYKSKLKAIF